MNSPSAQPPVLVVVNPRSGTASVEDVKRSITARLPESEVDFHLLSKEDDLKSYLRSALDRGVSLVIAAGGDGTISSVADNLVGTSATLAIIPMGTTNILARELGISTEVSPTTGIAAAIVLQEPRLSVQVDAMKMAGHHYFTQVGIGIDALMIRDTADTSKKRFGRLAYLWTAASRLVGYQPQKFTLVVDDRTLVVRASQIVIANAGMLGQPPFRWGPDIRPDDGELTVCIVKARSAWNYARLLWHVLKGQHGQSPHLRYVKARHNIEVRSKRKLPVQADGEIVGETPAQVELVPSALRVLIPPPEARAAI